MRKSLFMGIAVLALLAAAVRADVVWSANTFAFVEVATSTATNTVISVPWVGYTEDAAPTLPSRIDHLVNPRNLQSGDFLLAVTSTVSYAAWLLQPVPGAEKGELEWVPIDSVLKDSTGDTIYAGNDGGGVVSRGLGIWLIRQAPVEGAGAKPFYLNGQWTDAPGSVTIKAGAEQEPLCTLVANPNVAQSVDINDLTWSGVYAKDTVVIPTDKTTTRYCMWDSSKGKWYYAKVTKTVKWGQTIAKTEYVYDGLTLPAGTGFWYVSRGGTPTIEWK